VRNAAVSKAALRAPSLPGLRAADRMRKRSSPA
jgi:hypothetical protein